MAVAASKPGGSWRLSVIGLGLVTIVAYGVAYYSYGVLIDPIHAQTGWSSPALGAVFSGVLIIGGAGGLAGGRVVDRVGTRPAFLLAGTVGAGAVAAASYQHGLLGFGVLYAVGCGVIAALGFYHVTQPAAIRASTEAPDRAVVWLTILGAFASPIFLPLTAALVNAIGWRDTIRVLAAIAAAVFLPMAVLERAGRRPAQPSQHADGVADALRDAWHVPGFRRWVLASLISGAAVDVILVYQVPVMIATGLPIGDAATIGGIRGFAQLGGRIPLSALLRRLGCPTHGRPGAGHRRPRHAAAARQRPCRAGDRLQHPRRRVDRSDVHPAGHLHQRARRPRQPQPPHGRPGGRVCCGRRRWTRLGRRAVRRDQLLRPRRAADRWRTARLSRDHEHVHSTLRPPHRSSGPSVSHPEPASEPARVAGKPLG